MFFKWEVKSMFHFSKKKHSPFVLSPTLLCKFSSEHVSILRLELVLVWFFRVVNQENMRSWKSPERNVRKHVNSRIGSCPLVFGVLGGMCVMIDCPPGFNQSITWVTIISNSGHNDPFHRFWRAMILFHRSKSFKYIYLQTDYSITITHGD